MYVYLYFMNVHFSQKVPEYLERQVQTNPVILLTQVPPCSHVASVQWSTNISQVLTVYPSLHIHVKPDTVFTHLLSPHGFGEHGSRSTTAYLMLIKNDNLNEYESESSYYLLARKLNIRAGVCFFHLQYPFYYQNMCTACSFLTQYLCICHYYMVSLPRKFPNSSSHDFLV